MAFGQSMRKKQTQEENTSGGTAPIFFDKKSGLRVFRILPEIHEVDGKFVLVSPDEVLIRDYWYELPDGKKVRMILNAAKPFSDPWSHHIFNEVKDEDDKRRSGFKTQFAINVIDRSMIVRDSDGNPVYPDETGNFTIKNGKRVDPVKGMPEPYNTVLVLEGSTGKPGGKNMLSEIFELFKGYEEDEGESLEPHGIDIKIKTTGSTFKDVRRRFTFGNDKSTLDLLTVASYPRYNIAEWAKPWPNEMIRKIMEASSLEEVTPLFEEYGIVRFPRLIEPDLDLIARIKQSQAQSKADKKPTKKNNPAPAKRLDDDEDVFADDDEENGFN